MQYKVDIMDFVKGLIPLKIRGSKFYTWIAALLQPIQSLNTIFYDWTIDQQYIQAFNGQVVYLEHILNDIYDPVDRDIYIDDPADYISENYIYNKAEPTDTITIYNEAEGQPPSYLYTIQDNALNDDFIVFVPDDVKFNDIIEAKYRRIIDRYKHAGKRYSFEIYTP